MTPFRRTTGPATYPSRTKASTFTVAIFTERSPLQPSPASEPNPAGALVWRRISQVAPPVGRPINSVNPRGGEQSTY